MGRRLARLLRLTSALFGLLLAVFGHAGVAGAMPAMTGMEHDSPTSVCGVLCSSPVGEQQQAPRSPERDDDDAAQPARITAAADQPFVPRALVADGRFRQSPPSKVPLFIRNELLRL